jgi:hypothetical protein
MKHSCNLLSSNCTVAASLLVQAAAAADGGGGGSDTSAKALAAEIRLMRSRRVLRTLGLVQDLAGE